MENIITLLESDKKNLMVFLDRITVKGIQETMVFANLTAKIGNSTNENPEVKECILVLTEDEKHNLLTLLDKVPLQGINETMSFANVLHKIMHPSTEESK